MAEEQKKSESSQENEDNLKEIQEQIRRIGSAQIALAQGIAKSATEGTQKVIDGSSDAAFTGLQGGIKCWSELMGHGFTAMNEGIGSLITGYSTVLGGVKDTLKNVSDILKGDVEGPVKPVKKKRIPISGVRP